MRVIACCILLFVTLPSVAFVSDPELEPNPAIAGEVVSLLLQTGVCDGVLGGDNPTITVSGEQIEVIVDGVRNFDPLWCFFPTIDHSFPLGSLPPGDFVITVSYRFTPFGLPVETEYLGDLLLTVRDIPPQAIPILGPPSTTILALTILLMGAVACTRRSA